MSSIISDVWSLASEFVDNAKFVSINDDGVSDVANSVKEWGGLRTFDGFEAADSRAMENLFLYELIANSVNYCYWYGKYNIRPNKANCIRMYELLDESFVYLQQLKEHATYSKHSEMEIVIMSFIKRLSRARFPLLDYRVQHLNEILDRRDLLSMIEVSVMKQDYSAERWLDYLVTSFPGYSKDLFLKRAFLFIMQMYRRCGLFKKGMSEVFVPADYQIPKMLRWLGCLEYTNELAWAVDGSMLLLEGSQEECEIRAATIVACKRIADKAGCTCEEVDTYLFSRRNVCTSPFHLTITSNY